MFELPPNRPFLASSMARFLGDVGRPFPSNVRGAGITFFVIFPSPSAKSRWFLLYRVPTRSDSEVSNLHNFTLDPSALVGSYTAGLENLPTSRPEASP